MRIAVRNPDAVSVVFAVVVIAFETSSARACCVLQIGGGFDRNDIIVNRVGPENGRIVRVEV